MKKNKKSLFAKAAGVLSLLTMTALIFAGCVQNFDGTKVNYEQKKEEITGKFGPASKAWTGYVNMDGYNTNTSTASKQAYVSIYIDSASKLDMASAESAITFYKLKDNTDNAAWYPMHEAELTKTLVNSRITYKWRNDYDSVSGGDDIQGVSTYFDFDVDTESVTTSAIAVIVDATKLKDVLGNFVLNLDGNYKAGQESDSWIDYLSVNWDKEGNPTTGLTCNVWSSSSYRENFRPEYTPINPYAINITANSTDPDKYDITIPAYPFAKAPNETPEYEGDSLVSAMISSFLLRSKGLEEAAYKDDSLDWTFDTDHYKATTPAFAYGTKFTVIMKKTAYAVPEWFTKVYGHAAFTDEYPSDSKMELHDMLGNPVGPITVDYLKDEPDFIVNSFYDPDDTAWVALNGISTTNQTDLFNVSRSTTQVSYKKNSGSYTVRYNKFTITPRSNVIIDAYEDFIITGSNNQKLDAVITVLKNADENQTIREIYVETKEPIDFDPCLWVGSGTTLKENKAHPKQLKFGTFKDPLEGEAIGYVKLYN